VRTLVQTTHHHATIELATTTRRCNGGRCPNTAEYRAGYRTTGGTPGITHRWLCYSHAVRWSINHNVPLPDPPN